MVKKILDQNKRLRRKLKASSKNRKNSYSRERDSYQDQKENDKKFGHLFQRCAELQQLLEERENQLKLCEKLINSRKDHEISSVQEENSSFLNEIEIIGLNSQNENHSSITPCFRSAIKSMDENRSIQSCKSNSNKENNGFQNLNILRDNYSRLNQRNQIHYIDQNSPKKMKYSYSTDQKEVTINQSYKENEALLCEIKKVVLEFEDVKHSESIVKYIKDAFLKSTKYDDINSILQYSMKLLKCDDMSCIIKKIKSLQKQVSNNKQIKKPKDDNKHTEKKIEKNSNSQEISNLIFKLRDISGLDKKYDNVLVLKCLIKYFDKYTSHKF